MITFWFSKATTFKTLGRKGSTLLIHLIKTEFDLTPAPPHTHANKDKSKTLWTQIDPESKDVIKMEINATKISSVQFKHKEATPSAL